MGRFFLSVQRSKSLLRSGCPAGCEQGKITQKTDPCLQLLQTGALLYQGYNQRFLPR